jgi:predicted Zn-dependent protease
MELNQKPSFLKDVVTVGIFFVLAMGVHEKLGKYDYNLFKFAADYDKQHGVYYNPETKTTEKIGENKTDVETSTESTPTKSGVVYVHGLGNYNQSELSIVKESIESFYGLPCVVSNDVSATSNLYVGDNLMAYRVLMMGNDDTRNRHIYVTSEPLCVSDDNTSLISGHARLHTTSCVVSSYQMRMNGRDIPSSLSHTVTHEMAHNFGLEHCSNQSCLMKSHGLDTHELCNSCKSKLNLK